MNNILRIKRKMEKVYKRPIDTPYFTPFADDIMRK